MMSQEAVRSTARGAPKPVVVGALANFSGTSTRSSPATTRWGPLDPARDGGQVASHAKPPSNRNGPHARGSRPRRAELTR
jgi:hypothetical protein